MFSIYDIKTEYLTNPLGMDEPKPRFSYKLKGECEKQAERRIIVKAENGSIAWDSGFVASSDTIQIYYEGETLKPFTRYSISIEVKPFINGTAGDAVSSTEEAYFETGLIDTPWLGEWISFKNSKDFTTGNLRKEFSVNKPISTARLYVACLGWYAGFINGKRTDDASFASGWTDYFTRVQYQAYDVTELIAEGANCLGFTIAAGWYAGASSYCWGGGYGSKKPMIIANLRLTYTDGSTETIFTDEQFKMSNVSGCADATRLSDIYHGETYEAWRDDTNWKLPGYTGEEWLARRMVDVVQHCQKIVWQRGAFVRHMFSIKPVSITHRPNGTWVVDFGQNLVGRERFTLRNTTTGQTIVIKHGEMLRADGSVYTDNLRSATATTTYTTGSHELEIYEPQFTFYGFRYIEISGWLGELNPEDISAEVLYSDLSKTGSFECSNELINKLYSNIVWGQRGNFVDIPTDCPQRDERKGWTADTQVFMNVATYNMSCAEFYRKWIEDLNSNLLKNNGCFTNFCPDPNPYSTPSTAWADAGIICPWLMFVKYGDTQLLSKYYHNMAHWIDWQIENQGGKLIVDNTSFGDWLNADDPISKPYLCTAYMAGMIKLLIKIATINGDTDEVNKRTNLLERVLTAFHAKFLREDGGLTEQSQTAMLLALYFELLPESSVDIVSKDLVESIVNKRGMHLSTGFVGTPLLLPVLTKIGRIDVAYALLNQTSYPSWLYPVTQGATTMWERWDSWSHEKGFGDVGMNSFNHYAYGAVGEWFFETICGIQPSLAADASKAAFKEFTLAPIPGGELTYAKAAYESIHGEIRSGWEIDGDILSWSFSVPANTTANITLPQGWTLIDGCSAAKEKLANLFSSNTCSMATVGEYTLKFKKQ